MLIKKSAASLAAGAALALFMSAGAAQAGFAPITTAPNPSVAGASVTLQSTGFGPACAGANVEFRDVTGGGAKPLCSATTDGVSPVICSTNDLDEAGLRMVQAIVTAGPCPGMATAITGHTVNAAPTPVPTVGEWTMWGLTGLLLIGGGVFASRRFRATTA